MTPDEATKVSLLSKRLVDSCLDYLDKRRNTYGAEFSDSLTMSFIASFIGAVTYRAMAAVDTSLAPEGFADVKAGIECATAAGVTGALVTFTGEQNEFYCMIRVVPPAANKEPC